MTKIWTYGDSWEIFPIVEGEIWKAGTGIVAVHNIFDPLPEFMKTADVLFVDPPWNLGNVNSFYTKAGRTDYLSSFETFKTRFFECVVEINPETIFIEMGKQNVDSSAVELKKRYSDVTIWPVLYYKKNPCFILRGSNKTYVGPDLTGIDEADCIKMICKEVEYNTIGDFCMGRGLVGLNAFKAGRSFVGTELNKRRLAVLLDNVDKAGGECIKL